MAARRHKTLAGAGVPLMRQYQDAGLDMMPEKATFGGRFKVFKGQNDGFLEEIRLYHRKDGLIVRENDDAISAVRYASMMKRHGVSTHGLNTFYREIEYPRASVA
jgi:hypothetical protein